MEILKFRLQSLAEKNFLKSFFLNNYLNQVRQTQLHKGVKIQNLAQAKDQSMSIYQKIHIK